MKMVAIGQNNHSSGVVAENSTRLVAAEQAAMVRAVMNQMCWRPKYAYLSSSVGACGRPSTTGAWPASGRHLDRLSTDTGANDGGVKNVRHHCSSKMGVSMGESHAAYVFVMWPASRRTVMLPTTEGHVSVQKNGRVSTNWKPAVSTADRTAEWRSGKIWNASAAGTVHFDASERLSCRQARGSSPTYGVSCR